MKTTYINTGSTARLSADIDDLFNQLEKASCKACDSTVYPGVLSPDGYCADCLAYDLAAAPVPVVPTPLGSQRPQIENADNAVYRHQLLEKIVINDPIHSYVLFLAGFSVGSYLYQHNLEVARKRALGMYVRPLWLRIKFRILDTRSPSQKLHERILKRRFALSYLRGEQSK